MSRQGDILRAMADELRDGRATPSHQLLLDFGIRSDEILVLMELAADGIGILAVDYPDPLPVKKRATNDTPAD